MRQERCKPLFQVGLGTAVYKLQGESKAGLWGAYDQERHWREANWETRREARSCRWPEVRLLTQQGEQDQRVTTTIELDSWENYSQYTSESQSLLSGLRPLGPPSYYYETLPWN